MSAIGELPIAVPDGDRLFHRHDVGGHCPRRSPGRSRVDERTRQVALAEVDAFDAARRDGLRAQEQRADGLEAAHSVVRVQLTDQGLGVADQPGRLEADDGLDRRDRVGHEGAVGERLARLAAAHRSGVTLPAALDPRHNPSITLATLTP